MRSKIRIDGKWRVVTINKKDATGLLAPSDIRILMESGGPDVHEFAPQPWLFIHAAERINEILHQGGINKNDRAKTIAALLLSVIEQPPDLETPLPVLIGDINIRSEAELAKNGKKEFAPFCKDSAAHKHDKPRQLQGGTRKDHPGVTKSEYPIGNELKSDVLGQFYEVFLKYGNGAKEIGIVLTPRP